MIGLYRPGHSLLHRLPAGWKLLLLMVGVIAVIALVRRPVDVAVAAGVVAVLFGIGGIGPRTALAQIRPLFWMIAIIAVFQVIITTPARAVVVCGILVVTVAAASLVTLTTRVTAMLDVCGRVLEPLRRFGVDPDRIGLLLALTIRLVPVLTGIVHEVSDARKARGLQWSMTALATPVVVRALRTADALGDSLVARGVDDDRDDDA
ncbi:MULTISPECIES: energy-coupling factor transporter transmembrane component T family protein [unclassified Rhodococcus (in: high G+C Gram-positive bacteria)]|uniref:energy-coupling factor transporter transmembrane component T family protein n=1 Tax=unclassified Rhodococcus (in: high G+C Gram-positive bacteria) TaxID=192944 RepID=UPI001C9BA213|nr:MULTISPECIES: energy-coupling factor transporter transmembrane protein EcfT [unclassified Rhodococcus (in: high G+C Gram-positive bacteria)]MBY6677760.1 energy-coupling factor transporter transmembrane protein EcfT [Rhodococcus sp. BP-332]MBY6684217.1 energy-coupling factor transporter transmembrane protein EcfT [Rhodococcus sp. BP-288]MBY6693122.1 energy-coupling factor transporter transmembrane protein EcfT [Rhodococcus sp. BP-188]MBY6697319.1 energy-coupling factor transporter transmembra